MEITVIVHVLNAELVEIVLFVLDVSAVISSGVLRRCFHLWLRVLVAKQCGVISVGYKLTIL